MQRPLLAWAVQTRRGHGGSPLRPGEEQFIVDFVGGTLVALPDDAKSRAVVDVVQGDAHVSIAHVFRNPTIGGWRMSVRVVRKNPRQAVELRGVLTRGGEALTETWSYVLPLE